MSQVARVIHRSQNTDPLTALTAHQGVWFRYGAAIGLIAFGHVLSLLCWSTLGPATHTIPLAAVVIASLVGGYGPSLLATVLAGADLAYTFIPPYYSFLIDLDEVAFVVAFMAVAFLINTLQAQRRSTEQALRRERESLERRVGERTAELLSSQEQLRQLISDLVTVAEREQQRIGRDLHDGIGQELTGIALISSALAGRLRAQGHAIGDDVERVSELVRQSIQHTRDMARGLCPVDLEHEGLPPALGRLAERISRLPGVECRFDDHSAADLDAGTCIHLYRIAQEAINNALRHGQAKRVTVELFGRPERWSLSIADDGRGFSPCVPAGMGRRLMQHRASTVGATLRVTCDGAGVRVVCDGGRP